MLTSLCLCAAAHGQILVASGVDKHVQLRPDPGCEVAKVIVDGIELPPSPLTSYEFSEIEQDHDIYVEFTPPITYTVVGSSFPESTGTITATVSGIHAPAQMQAHGPCGPCRTACLQGSHVDELSR